MLGRENLDYFNLLWWYLVRIRLGLWSPRISATVLRDLVLAYFKRLLSS